MQWGHADGARCAARVRENGLERAGCPSDAKSEIFQKAAKEDMSCLFRDRFFG